MATCMFKKQQGSAVFHRNRVKISGGKLTGLAGILVWLFERRIFSIVILSVFEAPFGLFLDFRDAGMFGKRMGGKINSFSATMNAF